MTLGNTLGFSLGIRKYKIYNPYTVKAKVLNKAFDYIIEFYNKALIPKYIFQFYSLDNRNIISCSNKHSKKPTLISRF